MGKKEGQYLAPREGEKVNVPELFKLPLQGSYGNGTSQYEGVVFDNDGTLVDNEKKGGPHYVAWAEGSFYLGQRDTPTAAKHEPEFRSDVYRVLDGFFTHTSNEPLVPALTEVLWKYHRLPDPVFNLIPASQQKLRSFKALERSTQILVRGEMEKLFEAFRRPFMIGQMRANPKMIMNPGVISYLRKNHELGNLAGLCTQSRKNLADPILQLGMGYQRSGLLIPVRFRVHGELFPNKAIGYMMVAYRMKTDPSRLLVVDDRIRDVRSAINLEELRMQVNHPFFDPESKEWDVPELNKAAFRKWIEHIHGAFRGIVIAGHDSTPDRISYIREQMRDCPPNSFRVVPGVNFLTL